MTFGTEISTPITGVRGNIVDKNRTKIPKTQLSIWASVAFKEAAAEIRMNSDHPAFNAKDIADRAEVYFEGLMEFHRRIGLVEEVIPEPIDPKLVWGVD